MPEKEISLTGFTGTLKRHLTMRLRLSCPLAKKAVKGLKPSYPIFFDAEEQAQIDKLTTAQRTDMALKFCAEMTAIGLPSGVYANPSWMENYYDKSRLCRC